VDDEALLGNDPVINSGRVAIVAMQWLSIQVSTMKAKIFSVVGASVI
jgi:hypothetical protein